MEEEEDDKDDRGEEMGRLEELVVALPTASGLAAVWDPRY